jgi:hypothetical protein
MILDDFVPNFALDTQNLSKYVVCVERAIVGSARLLSIFLRHCGLFRIHFIVLEHLLRRIYSTGGLSRRSSNPSLRRRSASVLQSMVNLPVSTESIPTYHNDTIVVSAVRMTRFSAGKGTNSPGPLNRTVQNKRILNCCSFSYKRLLLPCKRQL